MNRKKNCQLFLKAWRGGMGGKKTNKPNKPYNFVIKDLVS